MTLEALLARFPTKRRAGDGWSVRCPAHEDQHASLSIAEREGKLLLRCHAGSCTTEAIAQALGLTLADLFVDALTPRRIVSTYDYQDEQGTLLYQVVRFEPKDFRPRRPDGAGGWRWSLGDARRVLYRLPHLLEQRRLVFVEGEKDADALAALGIPATTTQGGAAGWKDTYAQQCRDLAIAEVVILPDHDAAGEKYATTIARALTAVGLTVKIVRLPGLPSKGDTSDWLAHGGTLTELVALIANAPSFATPVLSPSSNGVAQAILVRLSDVEPEAVTWLWKDRIAVGKIALVIGNPGGGKTYLTSGEIASRVTSGRAWPDGGLAPCGAVILLTSEDGVADTLRPRMDKLGGDATQTYVLRGVRHNNAENPFNLESDLPTLEAAVAETHATLVIIDPLSAYLGSKDSYKDAEIRGILSPLAQLAERLSIALLGVLHLTKDQQRRLLMRAQGSIAFVAQARTVLAVGEDADVAGRRLFVGVKNNLGQTAATLAFRISDEGFTWETAPIEGNPEELLAVDEPEARNERREREHAITFLRDMLKDGPTASKVLQADAKENGIAQRTLWRAKDAIGVRADRVGTASGKIAWYWRLPTPEDVSS